MNAQNAIASGTICGVLGIATGGVGGLACGAVVGVIGFNLALAGDSFKEAAAGNKCFKVTRSHVGTIWYSTNNGDFCKN